MKADEIFILLLVAVFVAAIAALAIHSRLRSKDAEAGTSDTEPDAVVLEPPPVDRPRQRVAVRRSERRRRAVG